MAEKVTMKIDVDVHRKLQIVKGMTGAKTLSEALKTLTEDYIEIVMNKRRK
jgi:hypothetical protein